MCRFTSMALLLVMLVSSTAFGDKVDWDKRAMAETEAKQAYEAMVTAKLAEVEAETEAEAETKAKQAYEAMAAAKLAEAETEAINADLKQQCAEAKHMIKMQKILLNGHNSPLRNLAALGINWIPQFLYMQCEALVKGWLPHTPWVVTYEIWQENVKLTAMFCAFVLQLH